MRSRLRLLGFLVAWLFPAALAVEMGGCNDGSTGCCMVCFDCACGNSCISCAEKCTKPKGCACTMMLPLESRQAGLSVDGGAD